MELRSENHRFGSARSGDHPPWEGDLSGSFSCQKCVEIFLGNRLRRPLRVLRALQRIQSGKMVCYFSLSRGFADHCGFGTAPRLSPGVLAGAGDPNCGCGIGRGIGSLGFSLASL